MNEDLEVLNTPILRVGIAVTTYNRKERLARCVHNVREFTDCAYTLIVADDGSTDGTVSWLTQNRINYVTGSNRGIAWNKNRALFALHARLLCDVTILIEDDTYPHAHGWQAEWIEAATRWGHANLAGDWDGGEHVAGSGTGADPLAGTVVSGQVACFSRAAIDAVGYLDTRFGAFGFEHGDHTERLAAAGFGGRVENDRQLYYMIRSPITMEDAPSYSDASSIEANRLVLFASRAEFFYRPPFRSPEEYNRLIGEMATLKSVDPLAPIVDFARNQGRKEAQAAMRAALGL